MAPGRGRHYPMGLGRTKLFDETGGFGDYGVLEKSVVPI
jgi:hypothetical protein